MEYVISWFLDSLDYDLLKYTLSVLRRRLTKIENGEDNGK